MIELCEVRTRRELKRFVAFPERLYARHPLYVPKLAGEEIAALSADRNPAFEYCEARCWMAFRDGEPVGRIAGIINHRYITTWNLKRARFGWIDFVDDPDVPAALLGAVEGFDEMDLLITNYNHAYYPARLEALGYRKDVDWMEFEVPLPSVVPPKVDRVSQVVLGRTGLRLLETRSRRDLLPYVPEIFGLVNDAYKGLYGVVELSDRQIASYTKSFFGFINHEYVKIILDASGRVAAFGIGMPSLSRALQKCRGRLFPFGFLHLVRALRHGDRLDLLLIAVRPELQNKGVPAVIVHEMWKACLKNGIRHAETGPQLETNEKINAMWTPFHPRQHRRRRCYVKLL